MGLPAYLFNSDGELIAMDCTMGIDLKRSAQVPQASVMSKSVVSDDIIPGNKVITVTGRLSTFSSKNYLNTDGSTTVADNDPISFVKLMDDLFENKTVFTLYRDERLGTKVKNVVLTNYHIVQGKSTNSVSCELVLQQVKITTAATKTDIASSSTNGQLDDETSSTGTKTSKTSYSHTFTSSSASALYGLMTGTSS